jgi:hypothetical protein
MDIQIAFREVGTYRGAAEICGTTPKTVRRVVEAARRADPAPPRQHNYDSVGELVAERVERTKGRISAKRVLPVARAAGYGGSARNFRRLVADAKATWREAHHRGRRPGVWAPGEVLLFDWGEIGPLYVFCAVLAWSRWRFVAFAADLGSVTTMSCIAECLEALDGVPAKLLTDRMGCLKGGTVAGALFHPLRLRARLLLGRRPGVEGTRREPRGLREVRPHDPRGAGRHRSRQGQSRGSALDGGGERGAALRDLCRAG